MLITQSQATTLASGNLMNIYLNWIIHIMSSVGIFNKKAQKYFYIDVNFIQKNLLFFLGSLAKV